MMQRIMPTNFCGEKNIFARKEYFHLLQIVAVNLKTENKNELIMMVSYCNYRPILYQQYSE